MGRNLEVGEGRVRHGEGLKKVVDSTESGVRVGGMSTTTSPHAVLLIDPSTRTITKVTPTEAGYKGWNRLIGCSTCTSCSVGFTETDSLIVDDEGLYNITKENCGGFMLPGWASPVAGRALVVGTDPNTGKSVPTTMEPNDPAFSKIRWVTFKVEE